MHFDLRLQVSLQPFEKTHIHLTYHEGNQCVDLLAKEGISISDNLIVYSNPPFIYYQLYVDIWGVSYPKLSNI